MYSSFSSIPHQMFLWIIPLALFGIILKGMALWRASRRNEKWWFLALFVINSLGILPLLYLLTHAPEQPTKTSKK